MHSRQCYDGIQLYGSWRVSHGQTAPSTVSHEPPHVASYSSIDRYKGGINQLSESFRNKMLHAALLWLASVDQATEGCSYLERQRAHEAGHLLCGHLVGLDVERYSVGEDGQSAMVGFALEPALHGLELPLQPHQLEAIAITAMAGAAAELRACGSVAGEDGDVRRLLQLAEESGSKLEDDASRRQWLLKSTRTAMRMIDNHRQAFELVLARISEGADLQACVSAAESATEARWFAHIARGYPHIRRRTALS